MAVLSQLIGRRDDKCEDASSSLLGEGRLGTGGSTQGDGQNNLLRVDSRNQCSVGGATLV